MRTLVLSCSFLAVLACNGRSPAGKADLPVTPELEALRFSWVIERDLAGMANVNRGDLDTVLAQLAERDIALLVSLTETAPPRDQLAQHGLRQLHIPVEDFHPPTQKQINAFVDSTHGVIEAGGSVGVHCQAGLGRTGTMLAAYLVRTGYTADDAIKEIRKLRPGSIETPAQEEAIRTYSANLR